ncbi:MAG TPA: MBL fold metallo-hydrolase [Vicinamibacterales bacterium]|nr:MBL fold metallo-hydrolase [Vicinamibacterales bacterium]
MKHAALVSVVVSGLSLALGAQGSSDVVKAAADTMGAATLQSIQYSGAGSAFLVGQAASPGGPWPRFELAKYVASVDYGAPAMREETVRRDVEYPPRGGGAGPFNPATGQGGMRPIPGDVVQNLLRDGRTEAGRIQVWMTPHGFLKAAAANNALVTPARADGRTVQVVSFAVGARTLTGYINDQHLVERVETRAAHPILGDMTVEAIFSNYKDFAGVKFPTRIVQRQGGHPTLDVTVADVRPNGAGTIAVPAAAPRPPASPSPVTTELEKIADGVYFLTGGAPWSVLVEFSDHVVVIEAPQDDARSKATVAAVKRLMPAKPIRYLVNTHHHFDHSGGLRGYVAEGIPIITHEKNKPYFERTLRSPFTLEPDRLARSSRAAVIETVTDKRVLSDRAMTLELHHLAGNLHAETLLVAYLPKQKLLVQADAFHPRPGAAPLASPPPFTVNLVENIRRLKLDVERVVHVHGGVDALATVVKAAGL